MTLSALAAAALLAAAADARDVVTQATPSDAARWLAAYGALMRLHSGRQVRLAGGADLVPYAPLSAVWAVAKGRPESPVVSAGAIRVGGTDDVPTITVEWEDGSSTGLAWPEPPPEVVHVGAVHPVALFHDRLLALPLGRDIGGIPAGGRFAVDGTVILPGGKLSVPLRWSSFGDMIVVTGADGTRRSLPWTEVDRALGGTG